jgi:outer membrane protein assembly factor BamB/outer membrane lipoprotein-sorting protein
MDIIAGASSGSPTPDGRLHAIDGTNGNPLWIFTPGGIGNTIGDVAIGDFNGDAYPDVAIACWDDYVYAINGQTGNQLWSKLIGSIFVNAVDTGDVNSDGIDDVAFAHSYLLGYNNYQGVLDGTDGSIIWMQTVLYKVENVLMADIDDDSILEAVFGVTSGSSPGVLEIHVRNALNGNLEWSYTIGTASMNPDAFLFSNDIDGDGDLDLVVGNEWVNFYIYAFDGDSSTPMWVSEQLSGYARDIAFGDVIGDGWNNIIAATYDRVQVLDASNGTKRWYYSIAGNIATVSTADFNGDTIADIAAGGSAEASGSPPNPGKSVWALKYVQSPLLWEFNFGEYGNALAIDNLNGDQFMDVVTVSSMDEACAIDGEEGTEIWNWVSIANLYAVTTGDFNNDGQVDVAVAGDDDQVTALYGNNGNVIWQFTATGNQIYRKCLQATDLNNDGNIDVIAGCDDSKVYAINGLNGNQIWACHVGAAVNEVELAQMDATGPMDVVVAVGSGVSGKKVVVIDGSNGNILWSYNTPEAVEHVEVLDVNSDNIPDIAAAITPFTPIQIIMIDGSTHNSLWAKSIPIASNVHSLAHGDLNGDTIPDLVVPGRSTDKKVYALNGSNGNEIWDFLTGGEINTVAVEDIDSDGQLDVIVGSDDQNVYVLNGYNGSCTWSYSTADDIMHIQLGDISGDAMPNIACVTFGSDGVAYAFKSFSPAPNLPPNIPSNPSPLDTATYVDPDTDLSWTGGDPNGDPVTYDIYFDTVSPPAKIVSNQSGTSYDPGSMSYYETYYWKIVAWEPLGNYTEGPIWQFSTEGPNTPPNIPSNPVPSNGATNVGVTDDLSWIGGDPDPGDTVTYDVYFEADDPTPDILVSNNQSITTYDPGAMNGNTQYYWQIISWDNHGISTNGPLWNFTTENQPPNTPSNPTPNNHATNVDINVDLSWTCNDPDPGDTVTYDVYFEANDSTPDILVSNNQSSTNYDPGTMNYNTHYYWQIIAWDNHGASATGPIWDFTTSSEPNDPPDPPSNPTPMDDATDVDLETDLSWTCSDPDGDDLVYDVYFEADNPNPDELVSDDQTETMFDPGTMSYDTDYYWKIVAKDEHSASTTGPVWHFTTKENLPPDAPIITGPDNGKPNIAYDYTFNAVDSDGDDVRYIINWDDTTSNTTIFAASGTDVTVSHIWGAEGEYTITANAEDTNGLVGPEATKTVTMPRTKAINRPFLNFLQNFFETHPNLFSLLQILFQLLGLK